MNMRQALLAVTLVATLAASWWALDEDGGGVAVVQPVARTRPPGGTAQGEGPDAQSAATGNRLAPLERGRAPWPELADRLARIVSFAPPPSPVATARAEPQAPPLPFRYVGIIEDAQGTAVFLLDGTQVRMARPGEEVASRYRLERITPAAVEFTYLPLKKRQTLNRLSP
ncbi:hypothetical protein [Azoarcus sp. DN11]|uniref:hypothetical protein n=1 Tax=Azoarcus sp. DN11 TaxID=356837 RepID=UPI000EB1126D|nr:hypothetical protein [Azoarcus sp. DN11]AYH42351.1 hypothetical protein CDA09_02950 [Azoarcus sp. DN11]